MTKKINTKKIATTTIAGIAAVSALTPLAGNFTQIANSNNPELGQKAQASTQLSLTTGQMTDDLISADGFVYGAGTPVVKSTNGNWYVSIVFGEMPTGPVENQNVAKVPSQYVTGISTTSKTFSEELIWGQENLISMADIVGLASEHGGGETVNKIALEASIEVANARLGIADQYTPDSIANLRSVLAQSQAIYNSDSATQNQVDEATNNLNAAISALKDAETGVDKTALNALIEKATPAYNNPSGYTPETFGPFKTAYDKAVNVTNNSGASDVDVSDATFLLNNKFNGLEVAQAPEVDRSPLESAIAQGQAKLSDGIEYTDETKANLESAINKGQQVLAQATVTQNDIDTSVSAINTAIQNLEEVKTPEVDKTALTAAIKDAQVKLDSGKLTTTSQSKLQAEVNSAKSVEAQVDATEQQVADATQKLVNVTQNVTEKGDATELTATIKDANSKINSGKYTTESTNKLASIVTDAEKVSMSGDSTQQDMDTATSKVKDGIKALVEIPVVPDVNRDELVSVITEASKISGDKYTEDSFAKLTKAIDEAKEVRDNADATQDEVDAATSKVKDAMSELTLKPVEFQALEKAIDEANKTLQEGGFTSTSTEALNKAVKDGEKLLNDKDATQDEVDKAVTNIHNAQDKLVKLATDAEKAELEDFIKDTQAKYIDSQKYVSSSIEGIKKSIQDAQNILESKDLVKADIDKAMDNLKASTKSAVERASDFTKLQDSINKAKEKAESGLYTAKSVEALNKAIENAQSVLGQSDISQSTVDNAVKTLNSAVEKLVLIDNGNGNESGGNENNNGNETPKPDESKPTNPETNKPGSVEETVKPTEDTSYVIQDGDTLTAIAEKFGTDIETIAHANDVANPDYIVAGDVINVPVPVAEEAPVVQDNIAKEQEKNEVKAKAETPVQEKAENKDEVKTRTESQKDNKQDQNGLFAGLGALIVAGGVAGFLAKRKRNNKEDEGANL